MAFPAPAVSSHTIFLVVGWLVVRACVRACVLVNVCVCVWVCTPEYVNVCVCVCKWACVCVVSTANTRATYSVAGFTCMRVSVCLSTEERDRKRPHERESARARKIKGKERKETIR